MPTLCAGSTLEVALTETVCHDATTPSHGLHLVDLTTVGLRRLGLTRSDVIDSDPEDPPITCKLSAWLYENQPDAQGICGGSRQNDEGIAVVLFESRLGASVIVR